MRIIELHKQVHNKYIRLHEFVRQYQRLPPGDRAALNPYRQKLQKDWKQAFVELKHAKQKTS